VGIRETPETAADIHDRDYVHNDSTGQKYQIDLPCQVPDGKRPPTRRYLDPSGLTGITRIMGVSCICLVFVESGKARLAASAEEGATVMRE
jgi:hypothetical protein